MKALADILDIYTTKLGLKFIKRRACTTQLSMKFILLINVKKPFIIY